MRSYMPILSGLSLIGAGLAAYVSAPVTIPFTFGVLSSCFLIKYAHILSIIEKEDIEHEKIRNSRSPNETIKDSDELRKKLKNRELANNFAFRFSTLGNIASIGAQVINFAFLKFMSSTVEQTVTPINETVIYNQTLTEMTVIDLVEPNSLLNQTIGIITVANAASGLITYYFSEKLEAEKTAYQKERSFIQITEQNFRSIRENTALAKSL